MGLFRYINQFLVQSGSLSRKAYLVETGKLSLVVLGGMLFCALLIVGYFAGMYGVMQSTGARMVEAASGSAVLSVALDVVLLGLSTLFVPGMILLQGGLIVYAAVAYWRVLKRRLVTLEASPLWVFLVLYIVGCFFLPVGLALFMYVLLRP